MLVYLKIESEKTLFGDKKHIVSSGEFQNAAHFESP